MTDQPHLELSRRERQIMDVVYRLGRATAAEIHAQLSDPPTPTAVRTMLRILEDQDHLTHDVDGVRHVYKPVMPREQARRTILEHVTSTFFDGSKAQMMSALLDGGDAASLSAAELERLAKLIEDARSRRRK